MKVLNLRGPAGSFGGDRIYASRLQSIFVHIHIYIYILVVDRYTYKCRMNLLLHSNWIGWCFFSHVFPSPDHPKMAGAVVTGGLAKVVFLPRFCGCPISNRMVLKEIQCKMV